MNKFFNYIFSFFKPGESRSQKLKSNATWSMVIKAFAMILAFVKVPVVLSYLDNEVYGVWLTIVSIVQWTGHFDFGLGAGLRYKLTEAIANGDNERGRKLVSTAYISLGALMLGLFLILTPIVLSLDWNRVLNVSSIGASELKWTIYIVLALFIAEFVLGNISTIMKADQRAALSTLFRPLSELVALILIVVIGTFSKNSLFLASVAMSAPTVLTLILFSVCYFNRQYRVFRPSFKYFDKKYIWDIYSMGLKYFVGSLASLLVFSSAGIIISNMINPSEVAVYSTARTFFGVVIIVSVTIREPLKAAITDAYVRNDILWIKSTLKRMNKVSCLLSLIAIIMFVFGDFAVEIWTRGRIQVPFMLGLLFTLYSLLNIFTAPYDNFIVGVGKLNIKMIVACFKIVFFIPTAIILVKWLGSCGMVLAIIIINTMPNAITNILQYNAIMQNKTSSIWFR